MTDELAKSFQDLHKGLSKVKTVNINSAELKDSIVSSAKEYFNKYRPYLKDRNLSDDLTTSLDETIQDIILLTQGSKPRKVYLKKVTAAKNIINELVVKDVSIVKEERIVGGEGIILKTLESIIPTAALSYKQALIDLSFCNHKISYRGTATELRESLRETLDHLAPDKEVTAQQGFKLEKDQSRPTMKQKVRFIMKKRQLNETKRIPAEKTTELIEELTGQLARAVYNRASLSTHITTTKNEVIQIKKYIDLMFQEILEIG